MNKIILMGRLTKDPEIRYTQGSEPLCVAKFTLAVNRRFKKDAEQQEADFIPCVAFGKTAEFAERFFKKGMQPLLTGRMQVRNYDDNTGQKRWITEVIVDDMQFTESKAASDAIINKSGGDSYNAPPQNYNEPDGFSAIAQSIDEDDDLPF